MQQVRGRHGAPRCNPADPGAAAGRIRPEAGRGSRFLFHPPVGRAHATLLAPVSRLRRDRSPARSPHPGQGTAGALPPPRATRLRPVAPSRAHVPFPTPFSLFFLPICLKLKPRRDAPGRTGGSDNRSSEPGGPGADFPRCARSGVSPGGCTPPAWSQGAVGTRSPTRPPRGAGAVTRGAASRSLCSALICPPPCGASFPGGRSRFGLRQLPPAPIPPSGVKEEALGVAAAWEPPPLGLRPAATLGLTVLVIISTHSPFFPLFFPFF